MKFLVGLKKHFLFLIIFNGTLCSLHCSIKECFLVLFKKEKKYADEMRCIKSDIVSLRRKESVERKEAEKRREGIYRAQVERVNV